MPVGGRAAAAWEPYRAEIETLWKEGRTAKFISEHLHNPGSNISYRQLQYQLSKWNMELNSPQNLDQSQSNEDRLGSNFRIIESVIDNQVQEPLEDDAVEEQQSTTDPNATQEQSVRHVASSQQATNILIPKVNMDILLPVYRWMRARLNAALRSKVQQGYRRIEWTCDCGEELYGDFDDSDPHAVNELAAALQHPVAQTSIRAGRQTTDFTSFESSISNNLAPSQSAMASSITSAGNAQTSELPSSPSSVTSRISTSNSKYLALSVNTGEFRKSLVEIEVSRVVSDGQLFKLMKSSYRNLRGPRARFSLIIKPVSLRFVHFALFSLRDGSVGFGDTDQPWSIPPSDLSDYEYSPVPLKPLPPMPAEVFLHYLQCGDVENVHKTNYWL